jgi:hypothetical protein
LPEDGDHSAAPFDPGQGKLFYRWKKYAGMGVAELQRLKQLEDENRRLFGAIGYVPTVEYEANYYSSQVLALAGTQQTESP